MIFWWKNEGGSNVLTFYNYKLEIIGENDKCRLKLRYDFNVPFSGSMLYGDLKACCSIWGRVPNCQSGEVFLRDSFVVKAPLPWKWS